VLPEFEFDGILTTLSGYSSAIGRRLLSTPVMGLTSNRGNDAADGPWSISRSGVCHASSTFSHRTGSAERAEFAHGHSTPEYERGEAMKLGKALAVGFAAESGADDSAPADRIGRVERPMVVPDAADAVREAADEVPVTATSVITAFGALHTLPS